MDRTPRLCLQGGIAAGSCATLSLKVIDFGSSVLFDDYTRQGAGRIHPSPLRTANTS